MPGKAKHVDAALITSGLVAVLNLKDLEWDAALAQSVGCLVGGRIGGVLPDVLEPGTSSWHRKSFHSVTAMSAVGTVPHWGREQLQAIRDEAKRCRKVRGQHAPGCPEYNRLRWKEILCWLVVGFILGAAAGYVSHLVLDSQTPRGIRFL